jgi:hypothetical protein
VASAWDREGDGSPPSVPNCKLQEAGDYIRHPLQLTFYLPPLPPPRLIFFSKTLIPAPKSVAHGELDMFKMNSSTMNKLSYLD